MYTDEVLEQMYGTEQEQRERGPQTCCRSAHRPARARRRDRDTRGGAQNQYRQQRANSEPE